MVGPRALLLSAMPVMWATAGHAQSPDSLAIRVQHPASGAAITATDSTFVFGEVLGAGGDGVTLTVNGVAASVHGGGWIAFVPVEPDSFTFHLRAVAGGRSAAADHTIWVPQPLFAPGPDSLPYKTGTIEPSGPIEAYAGDTLTVSVIAAPGLEVTARLGRRRVPLVAERGADINFGRQVWGGEDPVEGASPVVLREAMAAARGREAPGNESWLRYAGSVYLQLAGALEDTLALAFDDGRGRTRIVPVAAITYLDPTEIHVAVLDDDTAGNGRTDGRVIARTGPGLGYQLFLPNGTIAATARRRGEWREITLGPGQSAWVPLGEAFAVAGPKPQSEIAVVRTRVREGWSEVVLPLAEPLPFRIEQHLAPARYTIRVYGLVSNIDWIETTIADPLIESVRWTQPENGVFRLDVDLAGDQPWGWRAYREGAHLVIGFRHPPRALDDHRFRSPLHGVGIVIDAGHNPDTGAVGPTGFEERAANLAIALELAEILTKRGARVVLTRATPDSALGLYDRTNLAIARGGELFVSIHNNALPDGVNPFLHNGTSVLYYHPQSEPLARAIQAELLPRTGLRDHGVWHQNIAVGRMNEMPSVLVESAFMMLPEQEALLKTPVFQRRIAEGIAAGIERFLAERGGGH